jgi:hypothetical protein
VLPVSTATPERPRDSLWPPVVVLRDTALLLVALLLVTLLADGDLALVLAVVLVLAWAVVAVAAPLFVLARVGLVLQRRQLRATP